jgi:2-polyprenyl-6-methoxyphenol hydroxylase-like FAD-dependent oxidoreductase
MTMSSNQADVLIIGAGPVGLFTALRLGQAGVKVLVIEKDPAILQLPRSCGYYPGIQYAFQDAGVYDITLQRGGFRTTGMDWRKFPTNDGKGGKKAGELIGAMPKGPLDVYGPPGNGTLNMPQPKLCQILLEEAIKLETVTVCFNTELVGISDKESHVEAETRDVATNEKKVFSGQYLVGTDGGKSKSRQLLGIPFGGHTWRERLLATDVWLMNYDESPITTTYLLDPVNYTVITPLTRPVTGEKSMWRIAFALDPEDTRSDEELLSDEYIYSHYDRIWPGPRPLPYEITNRTIYVIHQRLASTLKRGRCVLAGDAAHLINVSVYYASFHQGRFARFY